MGHRVLEAAVALLQGDRVEARRVGAADDDVLGERQLRLQVAVRGRADVPVDENASVLQLAAGLVDAGDDDRLTGGHLYVDALLVDVEGAGCSVGGGRDDEDREGRRGGQDQTAWGGHVGFLGMGSRHVWQRADGLS